MRTQVDGRAYSLGNFLRCLALPRKIERWPLTPLREKAIKIGAKVVRRSRYVRSLLAEVVIKHEVFDAILRRIDRLHLLAEVT